MPYRIGEYAVDATCDNCKRMIHPNEEVQIILGGKASLAPGYINLLIMVETEQRQVVHAKCPKE